jgi:hypothetical protein
LSKIKPALTYSQGIEVLPQRKRLVGGGEIRPQMIDSRGGEPF